MSTKEQMGRLHEHHRQVFAMAEAWEKSGYAGPPPDYPKLPNDLVGLTCGAKTQAGTPCKQKAIYGNGRCKWHGGMSTGPTSEAGREQARINGRKGGRPKKPKSWMLKQGHVSKGKARPVRWVFNDGASPVTGAM